MTNPSQALFENATHWQKRAETLLEENRELSEANDTLRAERTELLTDNAKLEADNIELTEKNNMLRAEVAVRRRAEAEIRLLVDAYSEHDTTEAVRRCAANLRDITAERDGWMELVESTLKSAGLSFRLTFADAVHKLVSERDELARQLEAAQAERNTAWTELRVIRKEIGADENEATNDEVARVVKQLRKQLEQRLRAQYD